ncbi:hypothetical protein ACFXB3_10020 [Streptomyces sp. NPDC059447]|uniref:hypothetical protein n=1 Tax=Streptomyces sp. NPDC059447 TaxID=3346834 RepID=UPI003699EBB1
MFIRDRDDRSPDGGCVGRRRGAKTDGRGLLATARQSLQRSVRTAAAPAETDFLEQLRDTGLRVRERRGDDGTLVGYVVALPGDRADAGSRLVWFSVSSLAYDLSLPRVRERFEPALGRADWTVAERLVRDAIRSSQAWPDMAAKMALLDGRGIDVAVFLMAAHSQGVGVDRAVAALLASPVPPDLRPGRAAGVPTARPAPATNPNEAPAAPAAALPAPAAGADPAPEPEALSADARVMWGR